MPSLVPAGYTRGPILFLGPSTDGPEPPLYQRFWQEAGGYGARIVLVGIGQAETGAAAGRAAEHFRAWESDSVAVVEVASRADAQRPEPLAALASATGILILCSDALRAAGLLGGTPMAQAIRRANAQNKTVGAAGRGAALLCQHIVAGHAHGSPAPFVHRAGVQIAPGLGIVNRVALDASLEESGPPAVGLGRLLAAVAYNPFLAGVVLEAETGVVIRPNAVMEVFGARSALVVDGSALEAATLHDAAMGAAASLLGVRLHVLGAGATFSFDSRIASLPPADLPLQTAALKAAF